MLNKRAKLPSKRQDHMVKYTTHLHNDRRTRLVENTRFLNENKATMHSMSLRFKLSTTYLSQIWSTHKEHHYWEDIISFLELSSISCRGNKNFYLEQKRQRKKCHRYIRDVSGKSSVTVWMQHLEGINLFQ